MFTLRAQFLIGGLFLSGGAVAVAVVIAGPKLGALVLFALLAVMLFALAAAEPKPIAADLARHAELERKYPPIG